MDNQSRFEERSNKIKSMEFTENVKYKSQAKRKVSYKSTLSFQFCPDTGPNEVLDSYETNSLQPTFGVDGAARQTRLNFTDKKNSKVQTPKCRKIIGQLGTFTNLIQPENKLLYNSDPPINSVILKTDESCSLSDTPKKYLPLEKEIFTEDSNSIKVNQFHSIDGELSLGMGRSSKYLVENQPMFKFADPGSPVSKIYNNEESSIMIDKEDDFLELDQKIKCDNMDSFGVIRSFTQNSLELNSNLKKVETLKQPKIESSNDFNSRDDTDKFQIFEIDDPTTDSIFKGQLTQKLTKPDFKYLSMNNIDNLQKQEIKQEPPQILTEISGGQMNFNSPDKQVMETPGFPKHRIQFKVEQQKPATTTKKNTRNILNKNRKFYNSMDKLDKLKTLSQEYLVDKYKNNEFKLKTQNCQKSTSTDKFRSSQSFQQINLFKTENLESNIEIVNKSSKSLVRLSSKEYQVLASKNSMSDLVSDQIEKLGTFSSKKIPRDRGLTFMTQLRLDHEEEQNNQSFEETPKYGNSVGNGFQELMAKNRRTIQTVKEEEKVNELESNNQTTIYEDQDHSGQSESQSYTFSGEERSPSPEVLNIPIPESGDRGSSLSKNSGNSPTISPSITDRIQPRTQIPQNQQDEVNSKWEFNLQNENFDFNSQNSSKSPQTVYQSYSHQDIQNRNNFDSLSQFATEKSKFNKFRREKTTIQINIIRGQDDDDKQSIKRFPKKKVQRKLTQKNQDNLTLISESPKDSLYLVPNKTEQPSLNIMLQSCSKENLSQCEDSYEMLNDSPENNSPDYDSPEQMYLSPCKKEQVLKKIMLNFDRSTSQQIQRVPSFGSEVEIMVGEDTNNNESLMKNVDLFPGRISCNNTPQSLMINPSVMLHWRNNQSQKLLDFKKMKNESPETIFSNNSIGKKFAKRSTFIQRSMLGEGIHSPMDNIGSPVALRSKFHPRRADSIKKQPSMSKQMTLRRIKSPCNSNKSIPINDILSQIEDAAIKRNSLIVDTSINDILSNSSKSKKSRNISSSYLKNENMQQMIDSPLKVSQYRQMTQDMFLQINKIKELMQTEYHEIPPENIINFKFKKYGYKKLLLFDLDETLIHIWRDQSELEEGFEPEIEIPIIDPESNQKDVYGLSVRPFVTECLQFANKYFEVGVFTASHEWFASQILDYLDLDGTLIQHRYYRQHTSQLDDLLVKDLKIFQGEVNLDDILIVDNNIYSFAFQLENGIPILDFMGDHSDSELLKIMKYLQHLAKFENLRAENEKNYKLKEIFNYNMENYIQYYESDEWSEEEDKDFDDDGITEHLTAKKIDQMSDNLCQGVDFNDELSSEQKKNRENELSLSECSSQKFDMPHIRLLKSPKSVSPPSKQRNNSPNMHRLLRNDQYGPYTHHQHDRKMSRNMFDFNKNPSNEINIIKLNLIGKNEADISVEDLSSSEIDIGTMENMSKRLGKLQLNLIQNNEKISPKSTNLAYLAQDLSFNRNDSPPVSVNRQTEILMGVGLIDTQESNWTQEHNETGSSGGTKDQVKRLRRKRPELEEEKVPNFQFEEIDDNQVPTELQEEFHPVDEEVDIDIEIEIDSILQDSERRNIGPVRRGHTYETTNAYSRNKNELAGHQNTEESKQEENKEKNILLKEIKDEDLMGSMTQQRSIQHPLRVSMIENDQPLLKQQNSTPQPQFQKKTKIIGHLSSKKIIKLKASRSMISKNTIIPPNWDVRKKEVNRRLNMKSELPEREKIIKSQSVVSAKYIDVKLDKFYAEMNKHWHSGAMRTGLLKNNPTIKPKYIIDPAKKCSSPIIFIDEIDIQMTAQKPPRPQINLTGVPRAIKNLTTPKHRRNFTFQIGNNLKKNSLRLDERNLSDIKKYYENYNIEADIGPSFFCQDSVVAQTQSSYTRIDQFFTPSKQLPPTHNAFDNYKNWSNKKK